MRKTKEDALYALALVVIVLMPFAWTCITSEPTPATKREESEVIIEWKQETEIEEVTIAPVRPEGSETTITPYNDIHFYDVPLSEDLQMHLFMECDGHNIAPAIIIAMIERESDFDASDIGDNGNSFGLMQIQPKWHQATMDKLGCNDLLDPYQNITVGVAIVAQLKEKNPDLYWVLMAYNMGPGKATSRWEKWNFSDYAIEVVERASEIADEYESRREYGSN